VGLLVVVVGFCVDDLVGVGVVVVVLGRVDAVMAAVDVGAVAVVLIGVVVVVDGGTVKLCLFRISTIAFSPLKTHLFLPPRCSTLQLRTNRCL
jgi:hypothetical protein